MIDFILEKLQKYFHPAMANAAERRLAALNASNDNDNAPSEVAIEKSTDLPHPADNSTKAAPEEAIEAADGKESYCDNINKRIIDMEQPIDRSSSKAKPSKPKHDGGGSKPPARKADSKRPKRERMASDPSQSLRPRKGRDQAKAGGKGPGGKPRVSKGANARPKRKF